MRDKRGFTLIELLAVIVILAVIALIATPIIMNVINDSKEGAAKDAMYGYVKAVELASAQMITSTVDAPSGDNFVTKDGNIYEGSTKILEVTFKGTKPKDKTGIVKLANGHVTYAELEFDGILVTYNGKEATIGGNGSTPTASPSPTGPYAAYAYDVDLVDALTNGIVSIASESDFTVSNGLVTYTNSVPAILVVPSEIGGQKVTTVSNNSFPVALKGLKLPNTVTTLTTYAFYQQTALTELVLPSSITQIENWIFDGATSLKYVKFTSPTPPTISEGANGASGTFRGLTLSENKIYVPSASLSAYQSAFGPSLPSGIQIVGY